MKVTELIKELESYRDKVKSFGEDEPEVYIKNNEEGYTMDIDYLDLWENFSKENDIIIVI